MASNHSMDQMAVRMKREAITVRLPAHLVAKMRALGSGRGSLNDLMVAAVEREVTRRQAQRTLAEVLRLREEVVGGLAPTTDSGPVVRELREGRDRRA